MTDPLSFQGFLELSEEGLTLLRDGVRKHPLLGLTDHPAYAQILAALLPEGHRLVKAIGVFLEPGQGVDRHSHPETTTLWYPQASETPLVVYDTPRPGTHTSYRPVAGEIARLAPNAPHAVPETTDTEGRLSIAVLSEPE